MLAQSITVYIVKECEGGWILINREHKYNYWLMISEGKVLSAIKVLTEEPELAWQCITEFFIF